MPDHASAEQSLIDYFQAKHDGDLSASNPGKLPFKTSTLWGHFSAIKKFWLLSFANEKLEQVVPLITLNFLKWQKKDITVKSLTLKNAEIKFYILMPHTEESFTIKAFMIVALAFAARGYECKMVTRDDLTRMSDEHGDVMYKVVFVRAKDGEAKPSSPATARNACLSTWTASTRWTNYLNCGESRSWRRRRASSRPRSKKLVRSTPHFLFYYVSPHLLICFFALF